MCILTAAPTQLDNILTLSLVGLLAVVAIIAIIRRAMADKKAPAVVEATPAPVKEEPTAPGAAGQLKLYGTDPKTAAMAMAIVADKMGKPINELRFISIKEVEK